MFNNGKKDAAVSKTAPTTSSSSGGHSLNSIVQGTEIEGTIKANSDIRVDGTIKGKLFCDAKVIIGPTGSVNGEIRCQNAVVEGSFDGIISVKELLNIRETARIIGEISYGKLIVQPGGVIDGTISMGNGNRDQANSIAGSANNKATEKGAKVAG
jgi:cytoskeletal protein CcmA (bactofilin family)